MKKSLVFLLILAVAGGIFAQEGSFSWSGAVDVNARMDFLPDDPEIYVIDDAMTAATVDFAYTLGGLELGIGFAAKYFDADDGLINDATIGLKAGYTGDNYGLHAEMDFLSSAGLTSAGPTSLWGYYTFLDGGLRLDAAYKGGGNGIWAVSDIVKDEFFDGWDKLDGGAGLQFTFTGVDSLSVGAQFPFVNFDIPAGDLFEYFFTYMTLGGAYDNGSLGVSLMVALNNIDYADFGVDFVLGFYYQINDAMKINFDAAVSVADEFSMSIGLGFGYNADPLGVGVTIKALDLTDKHQSIGDFNGMLLEIAPNVSYAFSDFLSAHLGITFDIGLGEAGYTKDIFTIEIAPGLDFTVAPNATIGLGYSVKLGLGDAYSDTLIGHNISLAFHWAF